MVQIGESILAQLLSEQIPSMYINPDLGLPRKFVSTKGGE